MNELVQYKFNQPLTYSEQERFAYLSGDITSADIFDSLMEYEPKDEWSIDKCLDEVGLYGVRGDRLYEAMCNLEKKLNDYKSAFTEMKLFTSIKQVKELITEVENYKYD